MKFINKSILVIISVATLLLIFACGHNHADGDGHNHGTEQHSEDDGHGHEGEAHGAGDGHDHGEEHEEGEIHLTNEQIETMSIKFGDFSQVKINDFVKATGTLGLPPNALTSVNAKADGFVKDSKKYVEGNYIKKGAIMAFLENPDFIQQQQKYLEVAAELVYDHQELERQQTLLTANAGIEKNVQKLKAAVAMKTATLKGVAKQLSYLGINVADLTTDNIVQRIPLPAPMSGYITSINMHNGMYVSPQDKLMEIVNEKHLHLELDIFEKDISNIKEGQKISFTVPAMGSQVYDGEVHVIGKEFNTENKTVRIHGHLEKDRPKFIKDLFVEAKIWLNDQTVSALPEKAVIRDGDFSYIYATDKSSTNNELTFEAIKVVAGKTDNGFTAIKTIDEIPAGMQIVTDGAYYVYAQSKAGELEHNH